MKGERWRLHKFLARSGVASRRRAEELIESRRVTINDVVADRPGIQIDPSRDRIAVDGRLVRPSAPSAYFLLYKPSGVLTTVHDPIGRRTVIDLVKEAGIDRRIFPVGRLDYDAEGALLLTDDGELANRLMHPRYQTPKTYLALVEGTPGPEAIAKLLGGIRLEDGPAVAQSAQIESGPQGIALRIVVLEGRNHLIKRMCAAIGHPVVHLHRPTYAGIGLAALKPGELRPLSEQEVASARKFAGLS